MRVPLPEVLGSSELVCPALALDQRNDAKLFENPPIVLFGVDEPFNAHAFPAGFVGDEIFLEFADSPNPNSRMWRSFAGAPIPGISASWA